MPINVTISITILTFIDDAVENMEYIKEYFKTNTFQTC